MNFLNQLKLSLLYPLQIRRLQIHDLIAAILIVGCTVLAWQGLSSVPFHPDESTQIYMSHDVLLYIQNPTSLVWEGETPPDHRTNLRMLDAPLTRYLIGTSLLISGQSYPTHDWDWAKTWEENQLAGALPSENILVTARRGITILIPLTLILLYIALRQSTNNFTALVSVLLLGLHPLYLLHGRRAMAEGTLIFAIALFVFSLAYSKRHPWLLGVAAALAFNAKQSSIALLPSAVIAGLVISRDSTKKMVKNISVIFAFFFFITIVLNPFLWAHPIQATQIAIQQRANLMQAQVLDIENIAPEKILHTNTQKIAAFIGQLFLAQPSFAEVGNYLENTKFSEEIYLSNRLNTWLSGWIAGTVLLILAIFGFVISLLKVIFHKRYQTENTQFIMLLLIATILQGTMLIVSLPLPWQRYYLPCLPFAIIWTSIGIFELINATYKALKPNGDSL